MTMNRKEIKEEIKAQRKKQFVELKANARHCGKCEENAGITTCAIFRAANPIDIHGDMPAMYYCCPLFKPEENR